eukprot:CAMPEP_0119037736 /NCGR_PEP_ID=MMETSP1177-20130426/6215_1 /TAXON_ID=2985 /ORGANISM="Ochromonas sp, Strain CCMP1899" /LENGTH=422 /DNA_ID=CAMNT_0006999363 /DNA_START=312 /DNA_END=1577 /DNA_ORIENTATION=-
MPEISYFAGFGFAAPTDEGIWAKAKQDAMSGKQVLLEQVLKVVRTPLDLLNENFVRTLKMADVHLCESSGFKPMKSFKGLSSRAPICSFGYTEDLKFCGFGVQSVLAHIKKSDKEFPDTGFIGIGSMDENWGWLSTHFLNRTTSWGFTFGKNVDSRGMPRNGQLEDVRPFLDHEKLLMMVVNQHTNVSHPKVITIPLRGITLASAKRLFDTGHNALVENKKITKLLVSLSSSWGPRPSIINCVKNKMGDSLHVFYNIKPKNYSDALLSSAAVLCVPGLGYGTYRIVETLLSGGMPVLERSVGFDRSYHNTPVLFVDDFAMLTPRLVRQAYVEALYHAALGRWDYRRITQKWWEDLLFDVSLAKNSSILMERHPMPILPLGIPFSRPLIPYECPKGGCGEGTHRTPIESCAIDLKQNLSTYNW